MPAPETTIDLIQKLAVYVGHDCDCPASDPGEHCICGLYELLRRASNVCQVCEAEIAAIDDSEGLLELQGILGEGAAARRDADRVRRHQEDIRLGRRRLELIVGGKKKAPTAGMQSRPRGGRETRETGSGPSSASI